MLKELINKKIKEEDMAKNSKEYETVKIGDLSSTQINLYGVKSTVTEIPIPSIATLRYNVSRARRKGYIRLNNTLKAMTVEFPKLTIGGLLIKHTQSPLRDETMKCISDAIIRINSVVGNPIDIDHREYDALMDDLFNMNEIYDKSSYHIRKKPHLDPRVKAAMKEVMVYDGDPEITPGILLKIDAALNNRQVNSYVPNMEHLLNIVDVIKAIQRNDPSKTVNALLNINQPTSDVKKPQRKPNVSIGDLINRASIEKNGKPLTNKKPLIKTKTQFHPAHQQR